MKITVLIPTTRNDGSAVSETEQDGIVRLFWTNFGAASVDGRVSGYWVNDGTLYLDDSLKLFVVCDESQLDACLTIVKAVGKQLGQLAMYVEIDRHTDVRIIDID